MTTTTYCPATYIKLNHILGAYVKCTLELYFFTGKFLVPIPRCPSTKSNTHTPLIGPAAAARQLYHPPTLHDFQRSLYFCEYIIHIYKERKPITSVAKNEQTLIGSCRRTVAFAKVAADVENIGYDVLDVYSF